MSEPVTIVPVEAATLRIRVVRGTKVLLDEDLAALYGVETRVLTQAVRRNPDRFPVDFMFELAKDEWAELGRVDGSSAAHGGRRHMPLAFTEQGVAMLSSVLRSPRAVAVNVQIMRAFVRLREVVAESTSLSQRLDEVEQRHDEQIELIIRAIQQLSVAPDREWGPLGFTADDSGI